MTPQETYDTMVGGVLRQGRPGVLPGGGCSTITPDGCRCAAGFLVADDTLPRDLNRRYLGEEGSVHFTAWSVDRCFVAAGIKEGTPEYEIASDLVSAHDLSARFSGTFASLFRDKAISLAAKHGLNAAILAEIP